MERLVSILQSIDRADVIDIVAVSVLFYLVFALLKESRSFTALRGLAVVIIAGLIVWIVARVVDLTATSRLLERSLLLVVIGFFILFQNDLKKALTDFGQASIFGGLVGGKTRFEADEVVKAAARLSERKIGALIAIERRNSLRPYAETGTPIDAEITAELLRTIFQINTPLHDGAVIISGNRIASAGCLFPLSQNPKLSKDLGTRHRAGIGITEETDCVTIICSEETGQISIVSDGRIERNETMETLRAKLKTFFDVQEDEDE